MLRQHRKRILITALGAALLVGGYSTVYGAQTDEQIGKVSTDGSTSMEKTIGILGEAFELKEPHISFTYNPTGSGSGISAVEQGRCDIGLSSRTLKDEEKAKGLIETTLAYDGIVLVVNPENPVRDLTLDEINSLYTGQITNWRDLGGADEEVVLIGREAGSGTRDGFEEAIDAKNSCDYRQELTSSGDILTAVASNPQAIGYVSLASVNDQVIPLSVDGVSANEQTIRDRDYKIQRPFILVTKSDQPLSKSAQKFYDFAISDEAAPYIERAGVIKAD